MKPLNTRAHLGALAAATVVALPCLNAADYVWQSSSGTTNLWSTAPADTNWFIDGGAVLSPWTDGNAAIFNGATGEAVTLTGTVAPVSTTVNDNANWTLNGTGVLGGTGTLAKNGSGTLTLSNSVANTYSGGTTIDGGTLSLGTGGTAANTSTAGALGSGAVTVNNGSTFKLWIKNDAAFTIPNNISVNGGNILSEDGNYTMSGTVAVGASGATLRAKWNGKNLLFTNVISGSGPVTISRSADGGGSVDPSVIMTASNTYTGNTTVNSGILQLGNAVATDKGGTGIIRGTLTVNTPGAAILGFTNALGYTGGQKIDILNINGATVSHTANGDQGWGITVNMTGGTYQSTGTGRFTFGANSALNTLANNTSATVSGFLRIRDGNTNNNLNFTTADGLAPNDLVMNAVIEQGAAGYGITKLGPGTMQLNAANTYTGTTNINAGTLSLGNNGSLVGSAVVVNNSATFRVEAPGKTLPSITANNGSALTLIAAPGATTTLTGALNLADGASVSVSPILGAGAVAGTYDLITAGSITGTGTPVASFSSAYGPTRATGNVAKNGNKLQFTLTSAGASLVWNNASAAGAATGTWDTNTTANFNNGGSNDVFKAFDSVTFNDSIGAGAKTINVSGTVAPALITVNNASGNNYTLTALSAGGGVIAGAPSIAKSGAGTLTLGANLSYLGAGGEITSGGGTFDLGGKTLTPQSKLTVIGGGTLSNGTLPVSGSFDFQQGTVSATLNGAGIISKTTANTVILSGNNAITGAGTVSAGILQIGNAGNTGALGSGLITISSGAILSFNRNDGGLTINNGFAGTGGVLIGGTNNGDAGAGTGNGQSSYILAGNSTGFTGTITATNGRATIDNPNDTGSATLVTGTNGQFFVTAGVIPNAFTISGNGWGETTGLLGAIRLQGGTLTGPITLAGNSRITSHNGSGTISGPIGESGGSRVLEFGGSGTATNFTTVLTLSGASTYTGATNIGTASARLADINLTGSLGNTAVTVNTGSFLRGNGSIAGSLSFANGSTLGVNAGLPGNLTVAGAMSMAGTTTIALTSPDPSPGGSIPIVSYGSTTATSANFALANLTQYRTAVFNVGATSTTLELGAKALTWTGVGGLTWDVATTSNWTDATPAASPFYQGDTVTFNDSAGAGNGAITVATAITPAGITVDNSTTVPYSFTGAGSVGGAGSLVKNGNGTLSVNIGMPYAGGTTINGGVMSVDGNGQLNRQANGGQVTINNSGTFEVRGVNALPNHANSVNFTVNSGGTLRVITGTSPSTTDAIASHLHLGNLNLNGGTVDFIYAGSGTSYNGESFQLNGTLTVGGSSASTIQSTEGAANQGIALAGNRSFVVPDVTGDSTPDLNITAEVENSDTNNGAITKTGAGTLRLAAFNTYGGGTTVSAGTLLADSGFGGSATGTGTVTVAAGATLGGEGSAAGAVTVAGTIAPGNLVNPQGFLGLGATTLTGTYACQIDGPMWDEIGVTGNLVLTGSTLALSPVGAGITETSYRIATWTGTRTGNFTVTGLPVGYRVVYDNTFKEIRLEQGTNSPYDDYEVSNGITGAGPEVDSDGDGISNGLEFVLGGISNPTLHNNSTALLPTIQDLGASIRFSFHLTDDAAALDPAVWSVEFTDDLANGPWTTAVDPTNSTITITPGGNSPESGEAWSLVQVTIPKSVAKRFARLRVEMP